MYKNSSFVGSLVYFYNAAVIILRSEIFFLYQLCWYKQWLLNVFALHAAPSRDFMSI